MQDVLDCLPTLSDGRWDIGVLDLLVDAGSQLGKGTLDELALGESRAQEDCVDAQQDPGAFAERQGGEEQAYPQEDLEQGDQKHGSVIVFLDEATDLHGKRRLRLLSAGRRGSGPRSLLGWLDGGENVGASVSRNVEDRVDCEWKQCERYLSREQPDQAYDCRAVELSEFGCSSCEAPSLSFRSSLTQILHIFIREQLDGGRGDLGTGLHSSAISLEDHNSIGCDGRHKGQAICNLRPSGVIVERKVGEAIAEDGEQESEVAAKPCTAR